MRRVGETYVGKVPVSKYPALGIFNDERVAMNFSFSLVSEGCLSVVE